MNIPIADVRNVEALPIDAQNIITKVRIVIAGNISGTPPTSLVVTDRRGALEYVNYFPAPIVHVYEHDLHATYGCERSFAIPESVNPFLPPNDPAIPNPTPSDFTDANNVRDGDPGTYAELDGDGGALFYNLPDDPLPNAFGFKLTYELVADGEFNGPAVGYVLFGTQPLLTGGPTERWTRGVVRFQEAPEPTGLYTVLPGDARGVFENHENWDFNGWGGDLVAAFGWGGLTVDRCRVYEFYPLVLNEELLDDLARAQIRLPAPTPRRVTVKGIITPDREHTITGWPGGDFTGRVAQHQYELGATVIDFEQASSPVGMPAEAVEGILAERADTLSQIRTANYPLLMMGRGP